MRAWPSVQSLLPMGGNALWGDEEGAPDDHEDDEEGTGAVPSHGVLLSHRASATGSLETLFTLDTAMALLAEEATSSQRLPDEEVDKRFRVHYDTGIGSPSQLLHPPERAWVNPLLSPLPYAPNLTIHSLYGVGLPTERAYVVNHAEVSAEPKAEDAVGDVAFLIDRSETDGKWLINGVRLVDGDGTVPLLSLGYLCARGWRRSKALNPSGVRVTCREYQHQTASGPAPSLRGGPTSADHVDIMGNAEMIRDVMRLVGGQDLGDRVLSDIHRIAERVDRRLGGLIDDDWPDPGTVPPPPGASRSTQTAVGRDAADAAEPEGGDHAVEHVDKDEV